MQLLIVQTFQAGSQTLNAGVLCEPEEEIAREWIAQGYAEAVDQPQGDDQGESDPPPESQPPRTRRAKV
jgi:hypothetical protein